MSIELTACQLDEMRTRRAIELAVAKSTGELPKPRPQAPEPRKLGAYEPPGPGKKKPSFPRQSKLAPSPEATRQAAVDSPEAVTTTISQPGSEEQHARAGVGEAGIATPKKLSGLQKICRLYGSVQCGEALMVWDYAAETSVIENLMPKGSERWKDSELARVNKMNA